MGFGEKLFQLRTERGIYQKELAEYLSVSVGTISNYENGVHSPDLATLRKFAAYFQVSTDYLLGLTDKSASMKDLNAAMGEEQTVGGALNVIQQLSVSGREKMVKYLTMMKQCEDYPQKERIIGQQKKVIEQQTLEISRLQERVRHLEKIVNKMQNL